MKSICITGAVQSNLQTVANILQQAGMKQPKPARHDNDSIDIRFWHEQVMTLAAEDSSAVQPISNPGRLWEQLASDIFIANIESKVWGWSDTRSTWLLDYWLDFEPHLNFILICVSPQQMLASAMASVSDAISVEMVMSAWQAHHQELLRFHHRNSQRSLLVDFSECAHYPGDLIKRCIEQWKLPLATPADTTCYGIAHDSLAIHLAHQLCQDYPQIVSLQHELAATITHPSETDQAIYTMAPTPAQIIADYRALRDRSAELQQVQAANEALVALKTQHDNVIANHAQQQRDTDAKLKEATQENELLLLQLHQVQEEFETTFLKHESQQAQIDTLTQANTALKGDKEALVQEKSALTAQSDALQQEIGALKACLDDTIANHAQQHRDTDAKLKEAAQENELLLLQLHQVQEELETTFLKHESQQVQIDTLTQANAALKGSEEMLVQEKSALTAQRGALQQEVVALGQARDEQARILAECQAQIEQLNKTQTNLKEATQENELLLLQLHQVQEELEYHFLQHQDMQKQLRIAEARWQRLLQRNPMCLDYETIEILPASSGKDSVVAWRLTNFSSAGRHLPILEFKTSLEHSVAGLIFHRPPDGDSLLTRWPAAANQQNELILMPVGTKATHQQRAEILFDLATSDWSLLQPLTALLIETLTSSTILKEHTDFQPEAFRKGLDMFHQIIQKFPPTLRYDQVQLKREQVISGYEHLWLHFDNLSFDGKHWSEFEFRLACANVQPDRFGFHPKLEFPEEGGQAPFEAWFSESRDDFGTKLELRFAQPDAMDIAIWRRLTEHDHIFLAALIKRLPAILGTLQSLNVQLKRPWVDWVKMAREIQRIATLRIAVSATPQQPISPIQSALLKTSASPSKKTEQPLELSPTIKVNKKSLPKKSVSKAKVAKPDISPEASKV